MGAEWGVWGGRSDKGGTGCRGVMEGSGGCVGGGVDEHGGNYFHGPPDVAKVIIQLFKSGESGDWSTNLRQVS